MKNNTAFTFILFLGLQLLASFSLANYSYADVPNSQLKELREEIEILNRACARGTCRSPFQRQELVEIPPHQMAIFQEIATDLAQVWGDTILEGDYHADGNTQIDSILALYKNGEVFAYRIHYFERAWYLGNCDYNSQDPDSLRDCEEGRITEGTYISADFKTFFRDPSHFVDFISLNP